MDERERERNQFNLTLFFSLFPLFLSDTAFSFNQKNEIRKLHHVHHKYNKESTLSPFAGLAFSPLDGIAQALPYAVGLFFIPMHFFTHEMLLFLTAIWTNSIHDCLDAGMEPIRGEKRERIGERFWVF